MNIIRARKGYALDGARMAREKGLNCDENAHGGRSWGKGIIKTAEASSSNRDGAGAKRLIKDGCPMWAKKIRRRRSEIRKKQDFNYGEVLGKNCASSLFASVFLGFKSLSLRQDL